MRSGVLVVCTLVFAGCESDLVSSDGGSSETGSSETGSSETGDGDGDDLESLECGGVLRLDPPTARAWVMDGGAEIELSIAGDNQTDTMVAAAAGDYIAVARTDGVDGNNQDSIVHLFSRSSGELLGMREVAGRSDFRLRVSDDGWVSVADSFGSSFLMSATEVIELPDHHRPMAAPALGHVVTYYDPDPTVWSSYGWMDLDDLTWQPATPEPFQTAVTVSEDHHTLEYRAFMDDTPVFVRARLGETETIVLPFDVSDETHPSIDVIGSAGRYRAVRHMPWVSPPVPHVIARVDVDTGEAVLVDPELPPGWSIYDCYGYHVDIDGDGQVYYELHNDAGAGIWAYDVDADTWTQVGQQLGLVDDVHFRSLSPDALVVEGDGDGNCPSNWAEPSEDALIGDSLQLVRREPSLTMVLPNDTWQALIDRQQRCVASRGENGWEVRPLDGSDAVIGMPGETGWLWLD
jgi:hypothetical protein